MAPMKKNPSVNVLLRLNLMMMMMMMIVVMMMSFQLALVAAVDHNVGGSSNWDTGVDYTSWTSGQTFTVGDNLVFTWTGNHDVVVVSETDYNGCTTSSSSGTYTSSPKSIPLTAAGTTYYICSIPGHCSNGGMKVAVTTVASSTPSSSSSPPPPSSSSNSTTNTSPSPPPPSSSSTTPSSSSPSSSKASQMFRPSMMSLFPTTAIILTCLSLLISVFA